MTSSTQLPPPHHHQMAPVQVAQFGQKLYEMMPIGVRDQNERKNNVKK